LLGQGDELFSATAEGSMVQSSERYTRCAGKLNIQTGWGHIILDNIRLENDGLAAMGLSTLPISTFSILYYPFCFLINVSSVVSENSFMRQLGD
jgi:hypothetical protein